jgi:hypothetical protein
MEMHDHGPIRNNRVDKPQEVRRLPIRRRFVGQGIAVIIKFLAFARLSEKKLL